MAAMASGRTVTALALLLAALALAGCGRKGPLDTPYEAQVEARKEAQKNGEPVPPEPEKPDTDKPFVLDPLL